jgi:hypothetical protein
MIRLLLVLILAVTAPLAFTGCPSVPSERTAAVHTLQAVGLSAKSAMDASTQLLKQGAITVEQWQKVALLYDTKFQPAYGAAVLAVKSDLSSAASPDIIALAAELTNLVATFAK